MHSSGLMKGPSACGRRRAVLDPDMRLLLFDWRRRGFGSSMLRCFVLCSSRCYLALRDVNRVLVEVEELLTIMLIGSLRGGLTIGA
jgi:hypothetical protein